jgi:hypothetical protein
LTRINGGTASLSFNGTGITILGAKRANHGQYQVRVDGATSPPQNGSLEVEQFQTVLFETHNLAQGKHDVSIINMTPNNQFLDIDLVSDLSGVGMKKSSADGG